MNKKLLLVLSVILILFLAMAFFFWTTVEFSKPAEPVKGTPVTVATPAELEHSLILFRDSVLVHTRDRQASLRYDQVGSYIAQHQPELNRQPLNIVQAKDVGYQNMVDILNQMTKHHIDQYKLLWYPG